MSLAPPPKDPAFEAKRLDWIRCLDHKDPQTGKLDRNCVLAQVYDLVWNAGAYRIVLEARRIAEKDERGTIKLHGLTHQLLDRCFYQSQLANIRRLMDTSPLSGDRGVFSLKGLILNMQKNRAMFTRRNLFAAFEQSLDVETLRKAMFDNLWEREQQGHHVSELPVGCFPDFSDRLHQAVDSLCGTRPEDRRPDDVVAEAVFENLLSKLDTTKAICDHVNKFLAHAATPESRALVDADGAKITYEKLWHAHETICRACQFIDCYLLRQTNHRFLAMAPGDLFKHIEQPLVTGSGIDDLRRHWRAYAKQTESWSEGSLEWATNG